MADDELERLWKPTNLENLGAHLLALPHPRDARADPRRSTASNERTVVFLGRPLTLLRFNAPEYVLEPDHGIVRWQIRGGLLVRPRAAAAAASCRSTCAGAGRPSADGQAQAPHRGRGRELLPVDRGRLQHARCTR